MLMKKRILILKVLVVLFAAQAMGQLKLPALVSDGMVLQRDKKVTIWGWAPAGDKITVAFKGKDYHTTSAADTRWEISLPATKGGTTATLVITDKQQTITIKDVLFGDVWVCSGQSNMELAMASVASKYPQDIQASANTNIREFQVKRRYNLVAPSDDLEGRWKWASPATIGSFSAVGYYMARSLYEKYQMPIGIIHTSWGGTPAEAWVSEEGLTGFDQYLKTLAYFKDPVRVDSTTKKDKSASDAWYANILNNDKGLLPGGKTWADDEVIPDDWKAMQVPGFWETKALPEVDGVVWCKKSFEIPAGMVNKPATLILGMIDDADITYLNGIRVGSMDNKYQQRRYEIPTSALKVGKNTITVRIVDTDGNGGFIADKDYKLVSGKDTLNLSGEWYCKTGVASGPYPGSSFVRFHYSPAGLYNGMLYPIINYGIKGVAWYQGEANVNRAKEYRTLLPALIKDWRKHFNQGDFPFLIVQLANFLPVNTQPVESSWAELRDAQLFVSQTVPSTGLAVTIDIGEANDIHPLNKRDVGKRLALAAQKVAYGDNRVVYSGPVYKSLKKDGNKLILDFDSKGGGLISRDGKPLKEIAIAGADKKFVWAQSEIRDGKLIVWSDSIQQPEAIRYAWANNPADANLYNKEGLPTSPFRTDAP
jgi:sialate O-acetylesterase